MRTKLAPFIASPKPAEAATPATPATVRPITLHGVPPTEQQKILVWLSVIGEDDPATIAEILDRAATDHQARADYLNRAAQASAGDSKS